MKLLEVEFGAHVRDPRQERLSAVSTTRRFVAGDDLTILHLGYATYLIATKTGQFVAAQNPLWFVPELPPQAVLDILEPPSAPCENLIGNEPEPLTSEASPPPKKRGRPRKKQA